jgi:pSer/pThr/pTyr-binding forkhead associated (FHA) protein
MSALSWNTLLFAFKWVFIGLIYFALLVLLLAVRREMAQRVSRAQPAGAGAAGQLRVLSPGSDPRRASGEVVSLRPETRIGAEGDNDLILADQYISGYHARLRWDGVTWWIEDLGSRNGTFVNRRRCPPHAPQAVPVGATIQVGDMSFELMD